MRRSASRPKADRRRPREHGLSASPIPTLERRPGGRRMNDLPRVAVVGATGAVGSTMLGVMRERRFPAREIVPFASERSAGRTIDHGDSDLSVQALSPAAIQGFDVALFS